MALQQTFEHEPLESPERQIRLLEVTPSDDGGTQYCLTTYVLGAGNMPHFYALSYEWGTDEPSHVLSIDGKSFAIRKNLKLFLDRIYSSTQAFIRPLWIDAISIDQTNVFERNEQVKIMGRIFAAATIVLTWLGPKPTEDEALVVTDSTLQTWRKTDEYLRVQAGNSNERPSILSLRDPYGPMWTCLQQLCQLTYWNRRWIIQELIKANNLLFMWGLGQIRWNALSAAFLAIHAISRDRRPSAPITGPWDAIYLSTPFSVWQHVNGVHVRPRLLQVMETYQHSQCSVFHDKAYALTGISTNADQLQVDYEKSLPDLYADLMGLEPRSPHCLKYSKLVLDALSIDRRTWENGPVTGREVVCRGVKVNPVTAATSIRKPFTPQLIDTEMWQLFALATMSIQQINENITWAKSACVEIYAQKSDLDSVSYFLLLDGQVGMSLSPVTAGSVVYMVNGVTDDADPMFICQSNERNRADSTQPHRSSESSLHREATKTIRVWLSPGLSDSSSDRSEMSDSIEIRLGDLYNMNDSLEWDISLDTPIPSPTEAPSSPQFRLRRPHTDDADIRSPRSHRPSTGSSSIDDALRPRPRTKTWPSQVNAVNTDGWFIDALAREMRAKLFTGPSKLNSPD